MKQTTYHMPKTSLLFLLTSRITLYTRLSHHQWKDGDGLAVDDALAVLGLDGSLESSVHRILLEHIDLGKRASVELGESNPKIEKILPDALIDLVNH